jgi:hypothetical protein
MPARESGRFGNPCYEICRSEQLYDLSAYNLNPLQPNKEQVIEECAACKISLMPACVDECPRPGRHIDDCHQDIKLLGDTGDGGRFRATRAALVPADPDERERDAWTEAVDPLDGSHRFMWNAMTGKRKPIEGGASAKAESQAK